MTAVAELSPYLTESGARAVARRFRRNPLALTGGALVLLVLLAALFGPVVAPYDPADGDVLARHQGPSRAHPLGTD
jgi:peptide/nickel transport system permease protein